MRTPTVIPYRVWQAADGRRASTGGALPWRTPAERDRDGWQAVQDGFTIRWPDGTTGGTGAPFRTAEEAEAALADREAFTSRGLLDALDRLEAAGIDAQWLAQPTPGGGLRPFIVAAGECIGTPLELRELLARFGPHADATESIVAAS